MVILLIRFLFLLLDWLLLGSVYLLSFYFSFDFTVHSSRPVTMVEFWLTSSRPSSYVEMLHSYTVSGFSSVSISICMPTYFHIHHHQSLAGLL